MSSNPRRSSPGDRPHTRVLMACTSCRQRKVRCKVDPLGTSRPCERCRDRGYPCVFEPIGTSSLDDSTDDGVILTNPYASTSAAPPSRAPHHTHPAHHSSGYPTDPSAYPHPPTSGHISGPPPRGMLPPSNPSFNNQGRMTAGYGYPQTQGNSSSNWNYPPPGPGAATYNGDSSHHGRSLYPNQTYGMSVQSQNQYPSYPSQSFTPSRPGNEQAPPAYPVRWAFS
ncbi:hypothetical protein L218DRAFT_1056780 [Marasmius fiardii PR-910]|nr:hypothetical protein L218DRAFT_1056780 [Marasmius fiardii PR-910]